jgi:hypothetical protein
MYHNHHKSNQNSRITKLKETHCLKRLMLTVDVQEIFPGNFIIYPTYRARRSDSLGVKRCGAAHNPRIEEQ